MRSKRGFLYVLVFMTLICNLLRPTTALAQTARGTITGTVKDPTNAALVGALVEIQPLGKRVVSDNLGQFR
ncbi:MAG TPA: carboxypeptidase-like regulatory domain-containing protein, partial [Candidatus Acidoferrum sp.]|nr:carboxypeptidase-like regulatory domain-containing protein [Candidatus Acidoferrum sp.]